MADPTISGSIGTAIAGFEDQLWLIVPIGLGLFALRWGVPVGVRFLKSLSK